MKYLYHITDRKNIDQIKTLGLSPEFSKTGEGIYLSQDEGHSQGYEGHHGDWEVGTLLRIKFSAFNNSLLEADDCDYPDMVGEDYDESDWIDSLNKSGQCMYMGIIKPKDIECLSGAGKWKKLLPTKEKAKRLVMLHTK